MPARNENGHLRKSYLTTILKAGILAEAAGGVLGILSRECGGVVAELLEAKSVGDVVLRLWCPRPEVVDGLSKVGAKLLANALTQKLECCLPINLLGRTDIQRQTKEILRGGPVEKNPIYMDLKSKRLIT